MEIENKIRWVLIPAILWVLVFIPHNSIAKIEGYDRPIIVSGDSAFYPYEFINSNGRPDGFNVDLFEALMRRLNAKYSIRLTSISTCIADVKENNIDAVIGVLYSRSSASSMLLGPPHNDLKFVIVSDKSSSYRTLSDLKGKRVAVQKNGKAHDFLAENKLTDKLCLFDNTEQALISLIDNKCDLVLTYTYPALHYIEKNKLQNLLVADAGLGSVTYSYAVNKDNQLLLYALNSELEKMKTDGEYYTIYNKWFSQYQKKLIPKGIIVGLLTLIALLIAVFIFTTVLRYRVLKITAKLRQNESKFEGIFNSVDEAIMLHQCSDNGEIIDCNDNFIKMFGYSSKNKVVGHKYTDVIHESFQNECFVLYQNLKENNLRQECMITNGIDEKKWIEVSIGKIVINQQDCVLTVIRNIDERKRNEKKLGNIRKQLTIAIDAGEIAVWHYDIETGQFTRIHGDTIVKEKMTLEDSLKRMIPSERDKFVRRLDDLSSGRLVQSRDVYKFNGNEPGHAMYLDSIMTVEKDDEGKIIGIVGTQNNITENYEALQVLSDNKHKIELVIKACKIVQFDYDNRTKKITTINEDKVLQGSLIPSKIYLDYIHPDDKSIAISKVKLMNNGVDRNVSFEARIKTPSETEYQWCTFTAIPYIFDEKGRVVKYTGCRRNITQWKKITDDLIDLSNKAGESSRLKSAFLANISHEIRTPLNAIVGFSELIVEDPNIDDGTRREYVDIIKANNNMLLQIIGDILALSRVETESVENIELVNTQICVENLFKELIKIWNEKIEAKKIYIDCSVPSCNFTIISDRLRLAQVLGNLLSNAIKFTDEGSIKLVCELVNSDRDIYFSVSDTGCGVPEKMREQIFEPFVKIDSFKQGSGLGLSICKSIIERMGGQIGVNSKYGEFSNFWFRIPNLEHKKESVVVHEVPIASLPDSFILHKNSTRILVAEDDESNYRLIESILGGDYVLYHAYNGAEAVDLLKKYKPHLVLMDIKMPQMNGYEATKLIRELDEKVPIFAVTAYAFESDKNKILNSGFNGYISKPVRSNALRDCVQNVFNNNTKDFISI